MRTRKPKRFYLYANLSQINLSVSDLSMLNGKKIAMLENSMAGYEADDLIGTVSKMGEKTWGEDGACVHQ